MLKKLKNSLLTKKAASKKISKESDSNSSIKNGNLAKKRIQTKASKDEKVIVTKKEFESYIEMVRQEERSKLMKSGKLSAKAIKK